MNHNICEGCGCFGVDTTVGVDEGPDFEINLCNECFTKDFPELIEAEEQAKQDAKPDPLPNNVIRVDFRAKKRIAA